jgi:hypothetical protein
MYLLVGLCDLALLLTAAHAIEYDDSSVSSIKSAAATIAAGMMRYGNYCFLVMMVLRQVADIPFYS